jgi:hypothetical protein
VSRSSLPGNFSSSARWTRLLHSVASRPHSSLTSTSAAGSPASIAPRPTRIGWSWPDSQSLANDLLIIMRWSPLRRLQPRRGMSRYVKSSRDPEYGNLCGVCVSFVRESSILVFFEGQREPPSLQNYFIHPPWILFRGIWTSSWHIFHLTSKFFVGNASVAALPTAGAPAVLHTLLQAYTHIKTHAFPLTLAAFSILIGHRCDRACDLALTVSTEWRFGQVVRGRSGLEVSGPT